MKASFAMTVNPLNWLNPWMVFKRKKACKYVLSFVENIIRTRVQDRVANNENLEIKVSFYLTIFIND